MANQSPPAETNEEMVSLLTDLDKDSFLQVFAEGERYEGQAKITNSGVDANNDDFADVGVGLIASSATQQYHSLEQDMLYVVGERNSDGSKVFVLHREAPESEAYTQSIGTVASIQVVDRDAIVETDPKPEVRVSNSGGIHYLSFAINNLRDLSTRELTFNERKRFLEISKELRDLRDNVRQRKLRAAKKETTVVLNEAFGSGAKKES